ncbi:hypothetical protein HU200_064911 [Digitaria exilis]|uniref:DUF1618 domain-containing protein n=1 Tax=Digitaria exilis TaxID=1010633 RepID=A0A835A137_9POAL|nr:hypothetical protein HU200_064911 [Digitaria exilis]
MGRARRAARGLALKSPALARPEAQWIGPRAGPARWGVSAWAAPPAHTAQQPTSPGGRSQPSDLTSSLSFLRRTATASSLSSRSRISISPLPSSLDISSCFAKSPVDLVISQQLRRPISWPAVLVIVGTRGSPATLVLRLGDDESDLEADRDELFGSASLRSVLGPLVRHDSTKWHGTMVTVRENPPFVDLTTPIISRGTPPPPSCRRSIDLVSVHLIRQIRHRRMGTSCDSPSWVMLNCMGRSIDSVADAKTTCLAESPIVDHSTGRHLRVSIGIARPPPPAVEGDSREYFREVQVIAAHGDSLLLETRRIVGFEQAYDYFVYTHSSQRPSLSLLPHAATVQKQRGKRHPSARRRRRDRGGSAHVDVSRTGHRRPPPDSDWELKRAVPIFAVDEHGNDDKRFRFLCWVDCRWGFFLCDMVAEDYCTKLRYMGLPVMPGGHSNGNLHLPMYCGSLCCGGGGGVGGSTVRYVSINPRCCCGGPGNGGSCARSRHAFTVTAWSMCLAVDGPLIWHKETVLDCEEIRAHPGYEGLPPLPENPNMPRATIFAQTFAVSLAPRLSAKKKPARAKTLSANSDLSAYVITLILHLLFGSPPISSPLTPRRLPQIPTASPRRRSPPPPRAASLRLPAPPPRAASPRLLPPPPRAASPRRLPPPPRAASTRLPAPPPRAASPHRLPPPPRAASPRRLPVPPPRTASLRLPAPPPPTADPLRSSTPRAASVASWTAPPPPSPLRRATILLVAVLVGVLASTSRADLVITRADRRVDLTSHIVRVLASLKPILDSTLTVIDASRIAR